jgi:hypothetical protein
LLVRQNLEKSSSLLFLKSDSFIKLGRQEETILDQDVGDS